jgi:hypothetical protein
MMSLLILLAACGGERLAEVSGSVLIDGEPLDEGEIIFEEADNSRTPAASKIEKGQYKVAVLPGSKKVRITASRSTSKPDPVMGSAAKEPRIGPEFNTDTRLTCEVQPGQQSGVNFEVKETPRPK